jgi:hypothetical protein
MQHKQRPGGSFLANHFLQAITSYNSKAHSEQTNDLASSPGAVFMRYHWTVRHGSNQNNKDDDGFTI